MSWTDDGFRDLSIDLIDAILPQSGRHQQKFQQEHPTTWAMKKLTPGCWGFKGGKILLSAVGIIKNHYIIRIPIKQPVVSWKTRPFFYFFVAQPKSSFGLVFGSCGLCLVLGSYFRMCISRAADSSPFFQGTYWIFKNSVDAKMQNLQNMSFSWEGWNINPCGNSLNWDLLWSLRGTFIAKFKEKSWWNLHDGLREKSGLVMPKTCSTRNVAILNMNEYECDLTFSPPKGTNKPCLKLYFINLQYMNLYLSRYL